MQIVKGQKYCLRNGYQYRMLADDGGGDYPIIGLFRTDMWSPWAMVRHTREGVCHTTGKPSDFDLVTPGSLIRISRRFWLNLYPESFFANELVAIGYVTKDRADKAGLRAGRIACIESQLDFREGDGL